jgi:hypothetical protein
MNEELEKRVKRCELGLKLALAWAALMSLAVLAVGLLVMAHGQTFHITGAIMERAPHIFQGFGEVWTILAMASLLILGLLWVVMLGHDGKR